MKTVGDEYMVAAGVPEPRDDHAATMCDLALAIRDLAHAYAKAPQAQLCWTLGITEHICGVDNVQSLSNLALMTGNVGREGTGINPMRGQNNVQGAGDAGSLPNNYPGFQPVTDPANKAATDATASMTPRLGLVVICCDGTFFGISCKPAELAKNKLCRIVSPLG